LFYIKNVYKQLHKMRN